VTGQTSTHGEGSKTDGTNAGLGDRTTHPEEGTETDSSYAKEVGSDVIAHLKVQAGFFHMHSVLGFYA
jgi:hypothetical protein